MSAIGGSRVQQNLRHIVRFEAKPYPQAQSPTAVTRGFERVAFPKIGVIVPIHMLRAIFQDENTVVRRRAAEALEVVVIKELGCRTMVQQNTFAALVVALTDSEMEIRDACYRALLEASRFQCTKECLVGMGTTLPRLMDLVLQESLERSDMGLKILVSCAGMHRNEEALVQLIDVSKALPSLTSLLRTGRHWRIQEGAAALITLLTSRKDAKVACVGEGTVQHLLELLNHRRLALDNAALCALGTIAIANEGKRAIVDADGIPALLQKLSSMHQSVLRHVLECITNISESTTCRAELQRLDVVQFLKKLYEIAVCGDIRRSISQAIRQIEFINWPYELPLGSTYEPFNSEDEELSEVVE
ncbi:hypothetical protein BSKO_10112 [Bryopsis sp. KO-2023]|nr:hypothetical protein BSKO_10112 [Bryopsis sp. KO-2023]